MRRSLLFIPGNRENMLAKADDSEADVIVFDLEDSVAASDKENGRKVLSDFLRGFDNNAEKEIVVRINSEEGMWQKDISDTIFSEKVNGYMIPKATREKVRMIDSFIKESEIFLIPIIESPEGLLSAKDVANASSRIAGMLFGAEDYTTEMNIRRTTEGTEIQVARSLFAIICSASKIEAYDTPFVDFNYPRGLFRDTINGKCIGMTGKAAIHPKQVSTINKIYMPTKSEISKAKLIVKKSKELSLVGKGSFEIDGEMIDLPVITRAKKLLEKIGIDVD